MSDITYFPKNYHDSRQCFLAAAKVLPQPFKLGYWPIVGKNDDDLFVDHLWLPPLEKTEKLLVLTSGIHGSESYAGSAIQQMFMREVLPLIDRKNLGILIVHAMNPFGFKYHQRCTEAKVNLNRNFSVSGEIFSLVNSESIRLHEKFLPKKPVQSTKSYLLESMSLENSTVKFAGISMDEFIKSVSPGQFANPGHVEYGGRSLEPQSRYLINYLQEIMPSYKDIISLDLHTGLGDRGRLHMLTGAQEEQLNKSLFKELFDPEKDQEFYVFTPPEADGFYEVYGAINSAFADLSQKPQRVCAITMEFGTLGHSLDSQLEGLNNSMLEHQGQFYGYVNSGLEAKIKAASLARSYPNDDGWKIQVIKAARGTFQRILARSGNFPSI